MHLPERQAERVRRDLRHHRFEALPDRSRAGIALDCEPVAPDESASRNAASASPLTPVKTIAAFVPASSNKLAECRQRPGEKIAGAYGARSGRAEEGDFAFAGHRDAGQFGGRVGMGKTAPDRATGRITIFSARFTDAPRVRLCRRPRHARCQEAAIEMDAEVLASLRSIGSGAGASVVETSQPSGPMIPA